MNRILQIISSLLLGLSLSFFYWIGSFVLSQSHSVTRNLELDPSNLKVYIPVGIVIGAVIYWIIKKATKSILLISIVLFVLGVLAWWLVASPEIQQYIMPLPTLK
jgi:hypothetical protein